MDFLNLGPYTCDLGCRAILTKVRRFTAGRTGMGKLKSTKQCLRLAKENSYSALSWSGELVSSKWREVTAHALMTDVWRWQWDTQMQSDINGEICLWSCIHRHGIVPKPLLKLADSLHWVKLSMLIKLLFFTFVSLPADSCSTALFQKSNLVTSLLLDKDWLLLASPIATSPRLHQHFLLSVHSVSVSLLRHLLLFALPSNFI